MRFRKLTLAGLAVAFGATIALACGPDFPWPLLLNRETNLNETPSNSFDFEAARLVPKPAGTLVVAEAMDAFEPEQFLSAAEAAEAVGLDPGAAALLKDMRGFPSGADAEAAGAGLPAAARLYASAAVDFRTGAWDEAGARFQAVLDLPEPERSGRAVWAAFMLGRTDTKRGNPDGAGEAFRLARRLAIAGAPDPLGLGLASYGEEARLSYAAATAMTGEDGPVPEETRGTYGNHIAEATRLYAEQAARGSIRARLSLRIVAEDVLREQSRIDATVGDPLVQRLLVVYALAHGDDLVGQDSPPGQGTEGQPARPADQASSAPAAGVLPRLVEAIERQGLDPVPGADRLAALAYRTGRFDLAARLAERSLEPFAAWVRAKLAVRAGDLKGAAEAYAEASRALARSPGSLDEDKSVLLNGEQGIVAVARGDYAEALRFLLAHDLRFWGDALHLADRVLTVEELQRFVSDSRSNPPLNPEAAANLKDVLARRLVRAGRLKEAQPYFKDDATRSHAAAYMGALGEARDALSGVTRARAYYRAALLAHRHGMEIMGTEGPPDYAFWSGSYDDGVGLKTIEEALATADEKARHAMSAPSPDLRYHYRSIAAAHAERAADHLPPRSQAYAAVLCRASGWMMRTPGSEDRAAPYYRRYVREGAAVPFAGRWGNDCPEPDFDNAWRAYEPGLLRWIRKRLERR
jgi:tetratricopeptide (TPR) repeat protein